MSNDQQSLYKVYECVLVMDIKLSQIKAVDIHVCLGPSSKEKKK